MPETTGETRSAIHNASEKAIVDSYEKQLRSWGQWAGLTLALKFVLTVGAAFAAVLVTQWPEDPSRVRIFGTVAAGLSISASALELFGTPKAWRAAWRTLKLALDLHKAGVISLKELIERYYAAENTIVVVPEDRSNRKGSPVNLAPSGDEAHGI
jgi:hypothetical protein